MQFLIRFKFCAERIKEIEQLIKKTSTEYGELVRAQGMDPEKQKKLQDLQDKIDYYAQQKKKFKSKSKDEQQLNTVKTFVKSNVKQPKQYEQNQRYIPGNLTMNKLINGDQSVLLLGIEKDNIQHSVFIKDLLDRLEINVALSQIPPDIYYLIKTEKDIQKAWQAFVRGQEYNFYMNTKPRYLQQITLQLSKINAMKYSMSKSLDFSLEKAYMLQLNHTKNIFEPNAYLTPFTHGKIRNIIFCDYPILKERQFQAQNLSLIELRELFKFYTKQVREGKKYFDPRLIHYEQMLAPKINYIGGVIRLASKLDQKILAICDNQYTDMICEYWKKPFDEAQQIFSFGKDIKPSALMEYIEKMVILDVMLDPFVNNYFVKYQSFPFSLKDKIGYSQFGNSVFLIWDFYYKKYEKAKSQNQSYQDILESDYKVSDQPE